MTDFTQADTDIEQLVEKHQEERALMAQAREAGDEEAAVRHHQAALRAIGEAWRLTKAGCAEGDRRGVATN